MIGDNSIQANHIKKFIYIFISGCLFTIILFLAVRYIPKNFYLVRDDGLITLSHAKNLIEYGFIGVNPSGERVEGFSAPVQFLLYAIVYGIGKVHFYPFILGQSIIFSFLLGATLFRVNSDFPLKSLFIVSIIAFVLSKINPFLEWQWSGMENAITHFLLAASILALMKSIEKAHVNYWVIILLFFASISRAESMYHIGVLLLIYSIFYFLENKSPKGLKLALFTLLPWIFYQLLRFWYFGSFSSNTEQAQEISLLNNIKSILFFDQDFLSQNVKIANQIFQSNGGILLVIQSPLLLLFNLQSAEKASTNTQKSNSSRFLIFALLGLTLTAYFNPFLFGKTRLDVLRTTTQIAVYAAILFVYLLGRIDFKKSQNIIPIGILIIAGIFVLRANYILPYHLCCEINDFDNFRQIFTEVGEENNIHRPMIANADLGAMSWAKQFNIVDLGKLGNPILSQLESNSQKQRYFMLMKPDMFEIHTTWSIDYEYLLTSSDFQSQYILLPIEYSGFFVHEPPYIQGIWIRKDVMKDSQSSERRLINSQIKNLSIDRFIAEYSDAIDQGSDTTYIIRTVYRFLPEIIQMNQYQNLMERLSQFPLSPFEKYLLTGFKNAKAYEDVIAYLNK